MKTPPLPTWGECIFVMSVVEELDRCCKNMIGHKVV